MTSQADTIAADVVRRARAGDQNAMALIAETFESSKDPRGKTARTQHEAIMKYIDRFPIPLSEPAFFDGEAFDFGAEASNTLGNLKDIVIQSMQPRGPEFDQTCLEMIAICLEMLSHERNPQLGKVGAVIVANGRPLVPERVQCIQRALGDDQAQQIFGCCIAGDSSALATVKKTPDVIGYVFCGKVIGRARALQLVRQTPRAITLWCRRSAAEVT